jgi:hypothetical protein
MVIGTINICIGILTTVQQYLKISELNESHRVAAIAWDKFARNIRIELAKSPLERLECGHFLKHHRQEYDRLMETSPSIPVDILKEFKHKLPGKVGSDQYKKFNDLKKPDICDTITSAKENLYDRSKDILKNAVDYSKMDQNLIDELEKKEVELNAYKRAEDNRNTELIERQKEQMKTETKTILTKLATELVNKKKQEYTKINDYVSTFISMYGRKPMADEIENNFKDEVSYDIVKKYLSNYVDTTATDENV